MRTSTEENILSSIAIQNKMCYNKKRRMIEMKRIKIELSPEEDAVLYYEKNNGKK